MQRYWGCGSVLVLSVVLLTSVRAEAACDPCTNCSGDPVFVQKDSRNPELILVTRGLRQLGISPGVIDSIATVEAPSGKGIRIVVFEESGNHIEADIPQVEGLCTSLAGFLQLTPSLAADRPKAGPTFVNPQAFLRGE